MLERVNQMCGFTKYQIGIYGSVLDGIFRFTKIVSFYPAMIARNFDWFVAVFAVKNGVVFETYNSFDDVCGRI